MAKILIIEDDATFGVMLRNWLTKKGYQTDWVTTGENAQHRLKAETYDLTLTDLRLPDTDGILLLQWIRKNSPTTAVMIMTNYADVITAVAAIKLGAKDYLEKPIRPDQLNAKIIQALAAEATSPQVSVRKTAAPHTFIHGADTASLKLKTHMELVAPTQMSVLVTGESGTGKEYVAQYIHAASKRRDKPFVAIDCGAISKELGVSELFGHKKGAFTSALNDKEGVFEAANGGTVFLDEIGNLSLEIQMQLLRALQERKIRPVGSTRELEIDIRLISATNENLAKAIEEGRFREDLYHRINEFTLEVPPLRARGKDILLFARNFLAQANEELDKSIEGFDADTQSIFLTYPWKGNLRQMQNVIKRAVLFAQGSHITVADLPEELSSPPTSEETDSYIPLRPTDERQRIEEALRRSCGNKSLAAKYLQVDRKTLYNKLKRYGIE